MRAQRRAHALTRACPLRCVRPSPSPPYRISLSRRSSGTRTAVTATTASVASPPSTTDGTVPRSLAATPDSNAPISLELPMKMALTEETRPSRCSGRQHLEQRAPHDDAHRVHHPAHAERARARARSCANPEHDHRHPEQATFTSSVRPARRSGGRCASTSDITTAPAAGAARSRPRPCGPTCRISSAKTGKQRRGAAEQHREQVERQRAEHHRLTPDEPDAADRDSRAPILRSGARAGGAWRMRAIATQCREHQRHVHDVRRRRVAEPVDQPAERRTEDGGELPGRAAPRDGVGIQRPRHELGAERRAGRLEKAAGDAAEEDDEIDRPDASRMQHAGLDREPEQRERAAQQGDQATTARSRSRGIAIREVARRQGEPDERQRLGQADEAERQRVVRERVDLPGHDHGLELGGHVHRQQADDEPAEIGNPQRGVGIVS